MSTYASSHVGYGSSTPTSVRYASARSANRARRMFAFVIDVLVYGVLTSMLTIVFNFLGTTVGSLLYASFHDCTLGAGRSLGRAAMGHRLLTNDGESVSYGRAIARNAVRWLLWSTVLLFLIDVVLLFIGDGRILADHIMGTRVCEDPAKDDLYERPAMSGRGATRSHGEGYGRAAVAAEPVDPDVREAEQELNFDDPTHAHGELNRFEEKLAREQVESDRFRR